MISFFLPAGPTRAVRSSSASDGERIAGGEETKSEKDGPLLRRSLKDVLGRAEI